MAQVKAPVYGMTVYSNTAQWKSESKGQIYYCCAPGCKTTFDKEPEKHLQSGHGWHQYHD